DALALLLDVLGVPQAAVVAFSAGGPSALQFALRHSGRCWGVVLISARTQRLIRLPLGLRIMHPVLGSSDAVGWLWSGLAALLPRRMVPRRRLALDGAQTMFFLYSLRRTGSSNDLFQFVHLPQYPLSEIRQPTLVIHGTADRVASWSNAEFAAGTIPHAQLIRIPEAGHAVWLTEHPRLAPKILEFLRAHAPSGVAATDAA
ncbi:MAG: alpha/beta hydrolase, partial [Acidobacteriia bacterium]|nr:alpha/beta hydrolase [Terriglobia bacterium]